MVKRPAWHTLFECVDLIHPHIKKPPAIAGDSFVFAPNVMHFQQKM